MTNKNPLSYSSDCEEKNARKKNQYPESEKNELIECVKK